MDKNYNYVVVSRGGGIGDWLMIEPTIEALYYEYAPARIIIRTHEQYVWVLKDSPYVWKVLQENGDFSRYGRMGTGPLITDMNGLFDEEIPISHFSFNGAIEQLGGLHGVDAFAAVANVRPLRRTPCLNCYTPESNHTIVVQLRENGRDDGRDFTEQDLPMELMKKSGNQVILLKSGMSNKEFIDAIRTSDLFIGPDSAGVHIAHATGVRKIVGFYNPLYPATTRAYPGVRRATSKEELTWQIESALQEPKYPDYLNEGNGMDGIRPFALMHCRGNGLDVGSSEWPLPGAFPIHNPSERDKFGLATAPFDYIFSSHCLEHIANWEDELRLWDKSLRVGGTCLIYLPHPSMEMWKPGGTWVGGNHVWAPSPLTLAKWITQNTNLRVEEYSCYPDAYWSFYILARKVA